MTTIVEGLPELSWFPVEGEVLLDEGSLTLRSRAGVDWTNDAFGAPPQHRAAMLGFEAPASFALSARVTVSSVRSVFDAGALGLWVDPDRWAKVCFENSPQHAPMVVSVVTADGFADDCNSLPVTDSHVFLRVTRTGPAWAFHSSPDGVRWDFVRKFRLPSAEPVQVGFLSQAPLGGPCEVIFDEIVLTDPPRDLRDGT